MANPNALIIEVVGDTDKLKAGLQSAERDLRRFANRASSWDKRSARTGAAGGMLADIDADQAALEEMQKTLDETGAEATAMGTKLGGAAVKIGVAAAAAYVLSQNLQELGGNAAKFGQAFNALLTGNVVGFAKALQSVDDADPKQIATDLEAYGDAAKASAFASQAAALGLDDVAEAARRAGDAIRAAQDAVDETKIHDSAAVTGLLNAPSTIPLPKQYQRQPLTAAQRRGFFDTRIARELDRVQDIATVSGQVSTLKAIAAQIQERIDVTKDITRKLNLEDQLVEVNRRVESTLATAAAESTRRAKEQARLAEERAEAERRRLAALKEIALARQQSRDDLLLGLQTPGVPNLRKQLDQLTSRSDIGSIPNKLAASLDGARRILNRKWDTISKESRSNIADLFQTIRDALNEGVSGGPLTKQTQLSERIMAGLGLSAADERLLRARISHFNSAGVALTGTGSGSGNVNLVNQTVIDGKVVATTSAKYNGRGRKINPTQRNGPNAGTVVS